MFTVKTTSRTELFRKSSREIQEIYQRGFRITTVHADGEFRLSRL
jgi:hypothetical protein